MEHILFGQRYHPKSRPSSRARSKYIRPVSRCEDTNRRIVRIRIQTPDSLYIGTDECGAQTQICSDEIIHVTSSPQPVRSCIFKKTRLSRVTMKSNIKQITLKSPMHYMQRVIQVRVPSSLQHSQNTSPMRLNKYSERVAKRSSAVPRISKIEFKRHEPLLSELEQKAKNLIDDMLRTEVYEKGGSVEQKLNTISSVRKMLGKRDLLKPKANPLYYASITQRDCPKSIRDIQSVLEFVLAKGSNPELIVDGRNKLRSIPPSLSYKYSSGHYSENHK